MIQFDPPLNSPVTVTVPSTLAPGSRLCLHATVPRDEYVRLREDGTKVEVWSDFSGTWGETSFAEESAADADTDVDVDLSLTADSAANGGGDSVQLVATTALSPLVGRVVEFTYRLVHASGAVSWLGSEGTNGCISVESVSGDNLSAEEWSEGEHGVFSWTAEARRGPVVIARLGEGADWLGWAIGKEGPSRFTALSSAVTERVALALLPKARPGTYISYEPVLYHTTANATLSLTDSGEVLFHAGDTDSVLQASTSTSTWKNSIGDKVATLDTSTPHFLAVFVQDKPNIGRVHFLPMSGSHAVASMRFADVRSLVSSCSSLAVVAPASRTTRFLSESLSDKSLRVALGPAGGELLALPGYLLQDDGYEWLLAFLPNDSGSVPSIHSEDVLSSSEDGPSEYSHSEESSEHNTLVEEHPSSVSDELLLIIATLVRFLLTLAGSITSSPSAAADKEGVHERPSFLAEPLTAERKPGAKLAFEVTGKYTLVIKGEELARLLLSVDGKPLKSTPKEVEGNWLIESDAGGDSVQLQVALYE